jgi:hypothetical protein
MELGQLYGIYVYRWTGEDAWIEILDFLTNVRFKTSCRYKGACMEGAFEILHFTLYTSHLKLQLH